MLRTYVVSNGIMRVKVLCSVFWFVLRRKGESSTCKKERKMAIESEFCILQSDDDSNSVNK